MTISFILALLSAAIIPKVVHKFRPMVFTALAILAMAFFFWAHGQGWLIYHKWNHFLTVLYWLAPFAALIWYDRYITYAG